MLPPKNKNKILFIWMGSVNYQGSCIVCLQTAYTLPPLFPSLPLPSLPAFPPFLLSLLPPFCPPRTLLWTLTFTGCIWRPTIWCGTSQQEWPSSHAESPSYSASAPTSRMLSPLPLGYVPSPFPNQLVVVW